MKKKVLFSALLVSVFTGVFGQHVLYDQAEQAMNQQDFHSALTHFEKASAQLPKGSRDKIMCNLRMAECYLALGDPMSAVYLGAYTREAIPDDLPEGSLLRAKAFRLTGDAYLRSGRTDLALEQLKEAELLFPDQSLELADCFDDLGIAYNNNENKELALQYLEKSLEMRRTLPGSSPVQIADSYNNIGLIYIEDQPLKAIINFDRALKIYTEKLGNTHTKAALCYTNIAFANRYLKNYTEAINYLDQTMKIWDSSFEGDHPNKALTLSNKGKIFEEQGNYDLALDLQQQALDQYLRIYGKKHPEVANTFFLIGTIYQRKNEFLLAAENYQKSVYANLYTQDFQTVYDLPELRDYYNADILLTSLQAKAKALEALHFEKTLKLRDIDGALRTYEACDELISQVRHLRLNESDKLRLGQLAHAVYENGISIATFLSERTFKQRYYRQKAFEFCERSKSAILLEAINETKARHFADIPDAELTLEDSLRDQVTYLEQKVLHAESKEEESRIKDELFAYQTALRNFIAHLEKAYPAYYNLKYNQALISIENLQALLSENQAVLSYFIASEAIYVFIVTENKIEIISRPKEAGFLRLISGFRNAVKYQIPGSFRDISNQLYEQLIPKLPSRINSLIVIPDDVLGTLPFESLISQAAGPKPRYLIEDYSVSYDYSATLLSSKTGVGKESASTEILLTAPVNFENNEIKMQSLPGTEAEIREIRNLFETASLGYEMVSRGEATESLLKATDLQKFKYLHFATHGVVDQAQPERSRIFLCPAEEDDGSLYSGEIYNLKVNASLVALSACETGLGKIATGEGIVGLSRALVYAGAENLIVSLWQVADESTTQLMIEFYRQHLSHPANERFSEDLRKAKLTLLNSEKYNAPYYWAPFILIGR